MEMFIIMAEISEKVKNYSSNLYIVEIAIKNIIADLPYERMCEVRDAWYKLKEGLEELRQSAKIDEKYIVEAVFRFVKEFDIYSLYITYINECV